MTDAPTNRLGPVTILMAVLIAGLALAVALSNNLGETPEAKALAEKAAAEKAAEEAVAKLYREQSEALAKAAKDIGRLVRQKFPKDAPPPRQ
jgi:type II secretory pathway pseudopilin PulG